ncbi:hypothetical protein MJA45_04145 [Paenibacillus aurantius]|uniref:Uncharacterized protein n=1 Tax=Paenibacillus aurantius TaxID=2918900 RepID=A0AA96REB1_9BACL|nr:hypothetical protein [Paenibacillus aurantius]WNQ12250.1 hypothetical protein MJA45_04145 [Paenibacillus aurantius]
MEFSKGDWVTGYSKGVFQIIEIHPRYVDETTHCFKKELLEIGAILPDPIFVLKKAFSSNLRFSLGWESCAASFCKHISYDTYEYVTKFFRDNEKQYKKFEDYKIERIKSAYNLGVNINYEKEKDSLLSAVKNIDKGLTLKEILSQINDLGGIMNLPHNATLQLINYDFELDTNKRKIFREAFIF